MLIVWPYQVVFRGETRLGGDRRSARGERSGYGIRQSEE